MMFNAFSVGICCFFVDAEGDQKIANGFMTLASRVGEFYAVASQKY